MTPDWWAKLNKQEQEEYIKAHPSTKMKVSAKPTVVKTKEVDEDNALKTLPNFYKLKNENQALIIKSIKSESGQKLAAKYIKEAYIKKQGNYYHGARIICSHFRGDVLDEIADEMYKSERMDELGIFCKDYQVFKKSFISDWQRTNEDDDWISHRRSWVALADYGSNKGRKFYQGSWPPTESEKVPSKNLTSNLIRMHKETQQFLMKKHKLTFDKLKHTKIELYRGVGLKTKSYAPAALESWTSSYNVATEFGDFNKPAILNTKIRASAILLTEQNSDNWQGDYIEGDSEYIVLGGGLESINISFKKRRKIDDESVYD